MFAFIIVFLLILVGKNKIEILTGDEQNGMSHGPVQIILTNQDKFLVIKPGADLGVVKAVTRLV